MIDNETWNPVNGYEGIYQVSSLGRVKRITNAPTGGYKSGYFMTPKQMPNKYIMYRLSKNGVNRSHMAHRLVAIAFCSPPDGYLALEVNHKNGIKYDNRANNLEWVTRQENEIHARDVLHALNPPRGERAGKAKLTNHDVKTIRSLYSTSNYSQKELATLFNVSAKQISVIVNRIQWAHI